MTASLRPGRVSRPRPNGVIAPTARHPGDRADTNRPDQAADDGAKPPTTVTSASSPPAACSADLSLAAAGRSGTSTDLAGTGRTQPGRRHAVPAPRPASRPVTWRPPAMAGHFGRFEPGPPGATMVS